MLDASWFAAVDAAKPTTVNGSAHLRMHKIHVAAVSSLAEQQNVSSHSVGNQEPFLEILAVSMGLAMVILEATLFPISVAVVHVTIAVVVASGLTKVT